MNWNEQAERIMIERFGNGKDNIIPLATVENGVPYVRYVNAYYEENSFYIITYALSNQRPRSKLTGYQTCNAASCGVFDPRGIRQMLVQARHLAHCSRE